MSIVRTRFAPSPTGFLHIGGLRTALYAYALAKKNKGDFILRIEDTDQKREVEGAVEALKSTLLKFGLKWDEIYVQSERRELYQKAAQKLVSEDHAFYCQCQARNAKEEGFSSDLRDPCRDKNLTSGAIKLKVPDGETLKYFDFVHKKEISWNSTDVYDATLLKSDGFPTYHLAVAVDDLDMKISHIIRGHDWLPSTPIHLLVFKYLGGPTPEIGHPTDILSSETGKKLSKRRDSVFTEQFLEEGYLPEALLNFVMLLGWAPSDNRELYTLDEFVKNFDIKGFQEANPRFFRTKLDWFNGTYIRKLTVDELNSKFSARGGSALGGKSQNSKFAELPEDKQEAITKLLQERITKISDLDTLGRFFWEEVKPDTALFTSNQKTHLLEALEVIEKCEPFDLETLNNQLMSMVKTKGYKTGDFFMDLRVAVAGARFTPPINESIIILGKDEVLKRIKKYI